MNTLPEPASPASQESSVLRATKQLERSERGIVTCKLLLDFLKSSTVQGLDANNQTAVATLVLRHMFGDSTDALEVLRALQAVTHRNEWVTR